MGRGRGFTLLELMIAVSIVGILAAVAVPSFHRYQLRAKSSELKIEVEALFKAEESIRDSERSLCSGAVGGVYWGLAAAVPASCGSNDPEGKGKGRPVQIGTSKCPWVANDFAIAAALDWVVQGSTYGLYNATVVGPPAVSGGAVTSCNIGGGTSTAGLALAIGASSDVDGDGRFTAVCLWEPQLGQNGSILVNPGSCPAPTGADFTQCAQAFTQDAQHPIGRPAVCSRDGIF